MRPGLFRGRTDRRRHSQIAGVSLGFGDPRGLHLDELTVAAPDMILSIVERRPPSRPLEGKAIGRFERHAVPSRTASRAQAAHPHPSIVDHAVCGSTVRITCGLAGDSAGVERRPSTNGRHALTSIDWRYGNLDDMSSPVIDDPTVLLRSTGAVRRFTDRTVDDSVVHDILDDARFAPSGGNRQPWRVAVVRDRALRRQLGDLMQPVWDDYIAVRNSGRTPYNVVDGEPDPAAGPAAHAPNELLDDIESAPVVLAVAADMRLIAMMDSQLDRSALTGGGSIYPFCWNLLLAARRRGLGGVLTTFLSRAEPQAAPLLGLPEHHALAATIVLGYSEHQATKLTRQPVESFTTIDRFDGPTFQP